MDVNRKWYALYVKSRHEYVTQGELVQKGIDTFLPSVKKLRQWKDRKKSVDFPLFPGYLFVSMHENPGGVYQCAENKRGSAFSFCGNDQSHPGALGRNKHVKTSY